MLLASGNSHTYAVGVAIFVVLLIGYVVYFLGNMRQSRAEVGSEIELAPNRKPYYDDEALEGPRLERAQVIALGFLLIIAVSLPLYWILEPTRQAGAISGYNKRFANWGSQLFAPTASGGFNCAGCHGGFKGTGGAADYTITNPTTGEVKAVSWTAPALNTVFYRFTDDEVLFILTYGRPYSPMSPWGLAGGGPMNDQQLTNLLAYLHSIQLPQQGCTADNPLCKGKDGTLSTDAQAQVLIEAQKQVDNGTYKTLGEALFANPLSGGAFSCARCHTKGWSYGDPQVPAGGAMGPSLVGGAAVRQFPNEDDQVAFIKAGSELGKKYGSQGQGSGKMPGFGQLLTDDEIRQIVEWERSR
jgi:mono/diheme cytochrome c family protein